MSVWLGLKIELRRRKCAKIFRLHWSRSSTNREFSLNWYIHCITLHCASLGFRLGVFIRFHLLIRIIIIFMKTFSYICRTTFFIVDAIWEFRKLAFISHKYVVNPPRSCITKGNFVHFCQMTLHFHSKPTIFFPRYHFHNFLISVPSHDFAFRSARKNLPCWLLGCYRLLFTKRQKQLI